MSYLFISELRNNPRNPAKKAKKDAQWKRHLKVPADRKFPAVDSSMLGKPGHTNSACDDDYYMQIYALNKPLCPDPAYAVEFALIRAEAVKLGWGDGSYETDYVEPDPDARRIYDSDVDKIKARTSAASKAAWLIPMVSEYVLRTVGNHYVFENEGAYKSPHIMMLKASRASDVIGLMSSGLLYYSVLHWAGYRKPYDVVGLHLDDAVVPKPLATRHNHLPPTAAVISLVDRAGKHMVANGFTYDGNCNFNAEMKVVKLMAAMVRKDPLKYHPYSIKYNILPLTGSAKDRYDRAKEMAFRMAPIARAFVAVVMPSSPLMRAAPLRKVADKRRIAFEEAKREFRTQLMVSEFEKLGV
ncbi:hypothetical protein EC988_000334 [Linderina pennispora]|nr:hypothetical protein EC988_000334 [Linderina pennispora]